MDIKFIVMVHSIKRFSRYNIESYYIVIAFTNTVNAT